MLLKPTKDLGRDALIDASRAALLEMIVDKGVPREPIKSVLETVDVPPLLEAASRGVMPLLHTLHSQVAEDSA